VVELAPFYAFVSTTAVYQTWNTASVDESTATWPGVADEDGDPADFEKLRVHKRGCELAVEQTYGLAPAWSRALGRSWDRTTTWASCRGGSPGSPRAAG
jgi:hypothetical protein